MEADDDDKEVSGMPPFELARSYLAYISRGFRRHRLLAALVTLACMGLTVAAVEVWPRTYGCTTVLSAQDSRVLDGDKTGGSLGGASEVILGSENVGSIVDELHLVSRWEATRSPVARVKDTVMGWIRGEVSEAAKRKALIAMVQNNITVQPPGYNESKLTIIAEWSDPKTAAAVADAADQSFLRARHVAEISTITEYLTILEGHADELRVEIQSMASQGKTDEKAQPKPAAPVESARSAAVASPPPVYVARKPAQPLEDLTELRADLADKQTQLKVMEDTRDRRLSDAQQQLTELRTKFTNEHPLVVSAQHNVESLSQDTPQLKALSAEVKNLSDALKAKTAIQKEEAAFRGPSSGVVPQSAGATPGASGVDPLPADIMRLMREGNEELDPAVSAQFRTAVNKYATLRDKIGTARVDLDTAQAAFKHRYQIVIPAEAPDKPSKPKVPLVLGAGFLLSLLLGLLAPVLVELRTGKLVERWQVDSLGLPMLGEIRLPPASSN